MASETENWVGFGLWVKQKREAKGWTQEELAKLVGFADRQTIYRIETGASTKRSSVIKIAKALQEPPDAALTVVYGPPSGAEPEPGDRAAEAARAAELIEGFFTLPPEKQEQLIGIMRILRTERPELLKGPIKIIRGEDLTSSDAQEDTG